MKKLYVRSLLCISTLSLLVSCGEGNLSNGDLSSTMSGVAATGAPISNGKFEIKGKDGQIVEGTTGNDGSYSANIADLEEPYLVRVISPSGEKYISVASKSALAEGKKINVTPLSHTIVSNVFGNTDADQVFEDFETGAASYSDTKLEDEKNDLLTKLIAAGVVGTGGVVGADVDLLNGNLLAGTSIGLDGLLDVLDVDSNGTGGDIEIRVKGVATPIITDNVDTTPDPAPVALSAPELTAAKAQLSLIDEIRARMNALASLHSSKVTCNGNAVDNGGACDVDTLYSAFLPFFHTLYKEDGMDKVAGAWGWFCRVDGEEEEEAISETECKATGSTVQFENVSLTDITLVKYDSVSEVAQIFFNIYMNGMLRGSEEMSLKKEGGVFKLIGNKKTFKYWIETESLHDSSYNMSTPGVAPVESYQVNLNFHYKGSGAHTFDGNEVFTMSSVSGNAIFPGAATSHSLYLVRAPQYDENGACTSGLMFSVTPNPYLVFNPSTGISTYSSYSAACVENAGDPCQCQPTPTTYAQFDWDASQKMTLTAAQVAAMNKHELINLNSSSGVGVAVTDQFTIRKPLVINASNAASYIPSIGMTALNFCSNLSFTPSYNLSVASGQLNHISLHLGFSQGGMWKHESANDDFRDVSSNVFAPTFSTNVSGDVINNAHLYLGSRDEFERQFVRRIRCQ